MDEELASYGVISITDDVHWKAREIRRFRGDPNPDLV
jgi:hypothetical protein